MTSPVGLLDFFILEANDSIDRLDAVVSAAATRAPDIDVLLRHARTLRGSSTMARQNGIAEVASGVERVTRALRDGELTWSPPLHAARSEEHTSELQSRLHLVCRLLLEKKKKYSQ